MSPRHPLQSNSSSSTQRSDRSHRHSVSPPKFNSPYVTRTWGYPVPGDTRGARHRRRQASTASASDSSASPSTRSPPAAPESSSNLNLDGLNPEVKESAGSDAGFVTLPPTPRATPVKEATASEQATFSPVIPPTPKLIVRSESAAEATPHEPRKARGVPGWRSSHDAEIRGLLVSSVVAIQSIWGKTSDHDSNAVLPLGLYVKELLRRSRTTLSALQVALFYLHRARNDFRAIVLADSHCATASGLSVPSHVDAGPPLIPIPINSDDEDSDFEYLPEMDTAGATKRSKPAETAVNPALCGRRMFLAALIAATKTIEDRTFSNRAWAKISGLPVHEINANELAFLRVLDHQLFVPLPVFQFWVLRLATITLDPASAAAALHSLTVAESGQCGGVVAAGLQRSGTRMDTIPVVGSRGQQAALHTRSVGAAPPSPAPSV